MFASLTGCATQEEKAFKAARKAGYSQVQVVKTSDNPTTLEGKEGSIFQMDCTARNTEGKLVNLYLFQGTGLHHKVWIIVD